MDLKIWRLRRGMDRRFRSGHPWVYSNELQESPKGLDPGSLVELQDASGQFLARGYGNPKSLIAFRAVTRDPAIKDPFTTDFVLESLLSAESLRRQMGVLNFSHRLFFGESDGIPGLVIDRYLLKKAQVYVIQAHTAGVDLHFPVFLKALELLVERSKGRFDWSHTAVIARNDIGVRVLEGLLEEEPRVLKAVEGINFEGCEIEVKPVQGVEPLWFQIDLIQGQKTGFFLDQSANIQIAALRFQDLSGNRQGVIRILDLCCYVGQWSAQLAAHFTKQGKKVEVLAVDSSARALELAKRNIESQGAKCEVLRGNVLKDLGQLESQSFDLVISDPPGFIKSRKDIPAGSHAYVQLATQVFRLVRKGGGVVCCSCSALLDEETFIQAQAKGSLRNQVQVQWIARGGQAADHPVLAEFPEGRYLKAWFGFVKP